LELEDPDDKKRHEDDSSNLDDASHWKVQKYGDVDGGIFTVDDEEDRNGSELLGMVVDGDAGIEGIEEEESPEDHASRLRIGVTLTLTTFDHQQHQEEPRPC
jgi:hypothetical protein